MDNEGKKEIKHLVISGGGITGFSFYGALKESSILGKWNIDAIESIYGTSVGSILAVILALKYDWKTTDDYFIKRPWQNIYKFNLYSMIGAIQQRGIFTKQIIDEMLTPLFLAKDIPLTVTMEEFYQITKIDIHIFVTEIHSFLLLNISHTTHPTMKLLDAVYASSAVPILFAPLFDNSNNHCYCDGGMKANYAIKQCIEDGKDPSEIMGVVRVQDDKNDPTFTEDSTLIDYAFVIMRKGIEVIIKSPNDQVLHTEYNISSTPLSVGNIIQAASSMEERIRLIEMGEQYVREFYSENMVNESS
uniref:PNPLA domain-containing protein n=1 Tax=viral metagenome TaxID=1070528 RepID=A0A6C0I3N1_9ZZZZ